MFLQYVVISKHGGLQLRTDALPASQGITNKDSSTKLTLFKKLVNANETVAGSESTESNQMTGMPLISKARSQAKQVARDETVTEQGVLPQIMITGTVTDQNGQPVGGVVIKHDGKAGDIRTDSSGFYTLSVERLDKNFPILIFLKAGYKRKMVRIVESDLELRNRVSLNVTMAYSSETVTVNGWVGETNGTSIQGEVVKLISLSEGLYYSAQSDAHGNFSFEGIKRDVNYKVDIRPSENYKKIASEYLTISDHSIPLYITLEPIHLVNIEGAVVDSHGRSVKKLKFKLRSDINSIYDAELMSDEFGRFELPAFPMGLVSFTTESPEYFKVTGIDLSKSAYSNLVIPVDLGPHQLSGWVRNQHGLPLQGARAVLDAEFILNGVHSSSVRTSMTDETGYFEFTSLGPGEHYLTVYAKGYINHGVSYDTSARVDQLYVNLSQWSESMIGSDSLQIKINQASANVNRAASQPSSIYFVTEMAN